MPEERPRPFTFGRAFVLVTMLTDAGGVVAGFFLAFWLPWKLRPWLGVEDVPRQPFRFDLEWARYFLAEVRTWVESAPPRGIDLWSLPFVLGYLVVTLHLTFQFFDLYQHRRLLRRASVTLPLLEALLLYVIVHAALLWLFGKTNMSRLFLLSFAVVPVLVLTAARHALERCRVALRGLGIADLRLVVILGTGRAARQLAASIADHAASGYRVVGFVRFPDEPAPQASAPGLTVLGEVADLDRVLQETTAQEVIIARLELSCPQVMALVESGHRHRRNVRVLSNVFNVIFTRLLPRADVVHGVPLVDFGDGGFPWYRRVLKRALDLFGAVLGLLTLAPLFPVIALVIRWTSPGPVFFVQDRVTEGGRRFRFLKFRTMIADAERRQGELAHLNEQHGAVFKLRHDPRITVVGRLLRRFSLDELPQLWHVLTGDMSLVGPRPPVPRELEAYQPWHHGRFAGKGGITGLWQVSGRNELDFDEMVVLDRYYLADRRFFSDLRVLFKTVAIVIFGTGAF